MVRFHGFVEQNPITLLCNYPNRGGCGLDVSTAVLIPSAVTRSKDYLHPTFWIKLAEVIKSGDIIKHFSSEIERLTNRMIKNPF